MISVKSIDWIETTPERALTLPARYFYDEEIFKAERERVFYPAWHCIGHVNELSHPGWFLTFDIFDQSVVALRGDDGVIRSFHNVCQHRGTAYWKTGAASSAPSSAAGITHGATSRATLKSAPRSERLPDFDRGDFGLKPVRLEILGGFYYSISIPMQ